MPSGAYLITGGGCAVMAVIGLASGNLAMMLLFGIGIGVNVMLYRRAADREVEEMNWAREHRDTSG